MGTLSQTPTLGRFLEGSRVVNPTLGCFLESFLALTTRVLSSCFFFLNRELTTRLFARGTFQYSRAHFPYRLITLRVQGFPSYPSSTISRLPNGHAVGTPFMGLLSQACGAFPSRTCGGLLLGTILLGSFVLSH